MSKRPRPPFPRRSLWSRRVGRLGFIELRFEPRGLWLGVHWDMERLLHDWLHVYVCLVPMLPIHLCVPVGRAAPPPAGGA